MSFAMTRRLLTVVAIASLVGACASLTPRIPVHGSAMAIEQLVGEWEGVYGSRETGRSGNIVFRLRAGSDTAEGDVLITSRQVQSGQPRDASRTPPAPLAVGVRFVVVAGNEVSGALDLYRDPDCGCQLRTTFVGTLAADTIQGTFHTEGEGIHHLPSNGWWRVVRRAAR